MRSILKNKKAMQLGFNEIMYLIIGLLLIGLFLMTFVFKYDWGAMARTWLPGFNTTQGDKFNEIGGQDEAVWGACPEMPTTKKTRAAGGSNICPFFVEEYKGAKIIYDGEGYPVGYFLKFSDPASVLDEWGMFNSKCELIKSFKLGEYVLDFNLLVPNKAPSAELGFFNGQQILCSSVAESVVEEEAKKSEEPIIEYFVSDKDCYSWGEKYCIKYIENGKEIETKFYFKSDVFFLDEEYELFREDGNIFTADRSVCSIALNSLNDNICDIGIESYNYDKPRISGTKLMIDKGKYVFKK